MLKTVGVPWAVTCHITVKNSIDITTFISTYNCYFLCFFFFHEPIRKRKWIIFSLRIHFLTPIFLFHDTRSNDSRTCNLHFMHWICLSLHASRRKIPSFHQVSWCRNFVESHSFGIISSESPETMPKLCHSAKLLH